MIDKCTALHRCRKISETKLPKFPYVAIRAACDNHSNNTVVTMGMRLHGITSMEVTFQSAPKFLVPLGSSLRRVDSRNGHASLRTTHPGTSATTYNLVVKNIRNSPWNLSFTVVCYNPFMKLNSLLPFWK